MYWYWLLVLALALALGLALVLVPVLVLVLDFISAELVSERSFSRFGTMCGKVFSLDLQRSY